MTELKDSFGNEIRDVPLVVHWDGKLLPDISGNHEKVDRLPILVSGRGVERLLNVPKFPNAQEKQWQMRWSQQSTTGT